MYAVLAFLLIFLFIIATVVSPVRLGPWLMKVVSRCTRNALLHANKAAFDLGGRQRQTLYGIRVWLCLGAVLFVLLGLEHGAVIKNDVESIRTVLILAAVSLGASAALVLCILSLAWAVPGARGFLTLSRCGFRSLWVLSPENPPKDLCAHLASKAHNSEEIAILDTTGFDLLGKGPGSDGGLLYDLLQSVPNTPVSLLLLKPYVDERDPDRKRMTIFQSVLGEMGIQSSIYLQRVRATLSAVKELNSDRDAEARIQVRFHNEKPTMRAIIFDNSMLVSPWQPHADTEPVPVLEVEERAAAPSFYETFRRDYRRMWSTGVTKVTIPKKPERADALLPSDEAPATYVAVNLAGAGG